MIILKLIWWLILLSIFASCPYLIPIYIIYKIIKWFAN